MKILHAFALAAAALAIGFLTAHWCSARPTNQPPSKESKSYDFGALQQYESFINYLRDTKQTNVLQRFKNYSNASLASRLYAHLGGTLLILRSLRDGRTNQAYELLEGDLDADIVGFATSYRQLPPSLRNQTSLKILGMAKDYRTKHPPKYGTKIEDEAVAEAFKLLANK